MKQNRFKLQDMYKPTKQSLIEQNKRLEMYSYYGIPSGVFGDGIEYTDDEKLAIQLISENKHIPEDLENRLLESKHLREGRLKVSANTNKKQEE